MRSRTRALLYCRQDSRDLAIIQLKKVLSLNPKLVSGHQLLALLYIQEKKYDLAKKSLRNAGKIDANNTTTLRYLKEVNAGLRENNQYKAKNEVLEMEIPQLQEIAGKVWKKEDELKQLKSELAALDRKIQLELAPPAFC